VPDVGNFDDILAQARQGAADAGHLAAAQHAAPAAGEEQAGVADGGEAQAEGGSQGEGGQDGDGDLQILSSDDEEGGEGVGEMRLVELPSTIEKKRMPFIPTQVPACYAVQLLWVAAMLCSCYAVWPAMLCGCYALCYAAGWLLGPCLPPRHNGCQTAGLACPKCVMCCCAVLRCRRTLSRMRC
jgi:hypothetical protein